MRWNKRRSTKVCAPTTYFRQDRYRAKNVARSDNENVEDGLNALAVSRTSATQEYGTIIRGGANEVCLRLQLFAELCVNGERKQPY